MQGFKPRNYNSVSPYLVCNNAEAVISFMTTVFDGEVLRRFDHPDGSLMHAEVRIDDTVVMIGGAKTQHRAEGAHIHVYVKDVDDVYARALKHGAQSVQEPTRKRADDDRRGGVMDACGNTWWIGSHVGN
jgi:uncharacterized glyoxalase superfamily protein PhnB